VLERFGLKTMTPIPKGNPKAPRFRLLEILLRRSGEGGEGSRLEAFFKEKCNAEDWGDALTLLHGHGVAPWTYSLLSGEGLLGALPASFADGLRGLHRESSLTHFTLLSEYRRLADLFREQGIPAVPLKGAALFTTLYGQPGQRPMQDMDWLVREEDFPAAEGALRSAGYRPPPALDIEGARKKHFHLAMVHAGSGLRVELHRNLTDDHLLPREFLEGIWRRVEGPGDDGTFRLDRTTEFVYLALHAFKHGFLNSAVLRREGLRDLVYDPLSGNRLVWFLDLHRLMSRSPGVDPGEADGLARQWGCGDALYSSVALASHVFGVAGAWSLPVGEGIGGGEEIRAFVVDRLAGGLVHRRRGATSLVRRLQKMDHAREVRPARVLDLLGLLTPAPEEVGRWRSKGGGASVPFLYLLRFGTGLVAGFRQVVRFLR
jgi:hypothetical protein